MTTALPALIAEQPFFRGLRNEYLPLVAQCATVQQVPMRQKIFEKGSTADRFYLIVRGEVAVETHFSPGVGIATVQTLGAGGALGWSWFYPPHVWAFAASALTDVEMIVFDGVLLKRVAEENPAFGFDLAKRVGFMLAQRLESVREQMLEGYRKKF
jgi:CRP/FNR family cyclic AMP-dependent transcriptional regulator